MKKFLFLFVMAFGLMSFSDREFIASNYDQSQVCCTATAIINGEPGPSATSCINGVAGPETINLVCKMAKNAVLKKIDAGN